jgi:hypothetical protein
LIEEAERRGIEPVVLFAADAYAASIEAFADLLERFPLTVVVPVFNEAVTSKATLADLYPVLREAAVPIRIPVLPELLKKRTQASSELYAELAMLSRIGCAVELAAWTRRAFSEFRALERRLLLATLQPVANRSG